MKKITGRSLLGTVAAASLFTLLIAPQSGWLVKSQVRMATGAGMGSSQGFGPAAGWIDGVKDKTEAQNRAQEAARIAARNPADTGLQMAATLTEGDTPPHDLDERQNRDGMQEVGALRSLLPHVRDANPSGEPMVHAALLRYLSISAVSLENRPDQDWLVKYKPHETPAPINPKVNLPENLALWEQSARAGERLDPDNAYFPLVHAIGLFAEHKDEEAVAAVERASHKPRYNDYVSDSIKGGWRLVEQAKGEPGYVARTEMMESVLLPHFARLRAVARLATVQAVKAEQAGGTERGFQIRMAVLRVGSLLRVQSSFFIGSLVGDAIVPISWARFGGSPALAPASGSTEEQRKKQRDAKLNAYCAYLGKIGYEDAAREVCFEQAAGEQSREMERTADDKPNNILSLVPAQNLISWWAVGVAVLSNALLLLLWGAAAALLGRTRRVQNRLPLHPAVGAGLLCTFVIPAWVAGVFLTLPEWPSAMLLLDGAGALCLFVMKTLRSRQNEKSGKVAVAKTPSAPRWAENARLFALTVVIGAALLGGLWFVGAGGAVQTWFSGSTVLGLEPSDSDPLYNPLLRTLLGAAISSAVPVLLLGFCVVRSVVKRVPVSVGTVQAFRRYALPTAAVLVLAYTGIALGTLREEARLTHDLEKCVATSEGRYVSDLLHKPWPGFFDEAARKETNR